MERFRSTFEHDIRDSDFRDLPSIIGRRYKFLRLIGKGSFGVVFISESSESGKLYATKVELARIKSPKLEKEYLISKAMMQSNAGYPEVRYYWTNRQYNAMVMELLGESLDDLHKRANRRFSIVTVILIAIQTLQRIEAFHEKGFIHRDIKPENFLIGLAPKRDHLYLIDYGLSKEYINPTTHQHIPFNDKHGLVGTLRYISTNVHREWEPSRRDDLISLAYLYVYFFKGMLPWQFKDRMDPRERCHRIFVYKSEYPPEHLYAQMPHEFLDYYYAVSKLKFDEKPDYAKLRQPFEALLNTFSHHERYFDWIEKPSRHASSTSSNHSHNSDQTGTTTASSATTGAAAAQPNHPAPPTKADPTQPNAVPQPVPQPSDPAIPQKVEPQKDAPLPNPSAVPTSLTQAVDALKIQPPTPTPAAPAVPTASQVASLPTKQPLVNPELDDDAPLPTGELTDPDIAAAKHASGGPRINHVPAVRSAPDSQHVSDPEDDGFFDVHVEDDAPLVYRPYLFSGKLPISAPPSEAKLQNNTKFPLEFVYDTSVISGVRIPLPTSSSPADLTSISEGASLIVHTGSLESSPLAITVDSVHESDKEEFESDPLPPNSPTRVSPAAPSSPVPTETNEGEERMLYFDQLIKERSYEDEDSAE